MAGVALLAESDVVSTASSESSESVDSDRRSSVSFWSKASTVATATGSVARQSADVAKEHLDTVRQSGPIIREKASKAVLVAGKTATEGFVAVKQTGPVVREKVSMAAVAAGAAARQSVEAAKGPAMRGTASAAAAGAVARHKLEVAKGQFDAVRQSGLEKASNAVAATGTAARQGVDAAKERVDATKEILLGVRLSGLAPGQSLNVSNPGQDDDDSSQLIAMAFARHHLAGVEVEDGAAAAELLRRRPQPTSAAGAARSRVKASLKKVRLSMRSTKRRMTALIKKTVAHKNAHKQRRAAGANTAQQPSRSDLRNREATTDTEATTNTEGTVTPPNVFELFSDEELALQQALTESMESVEWSATPLDARQPATVVEFFPNEMASEIFPAEHDELAPEIVARAWFLQPSAGTWLLFPPHQLQGSPVTSLTIDTDSVSLDTNPFASSPEKNITFPLFSGDAEDDKLETPSEIVTSKVVAAACASPVQLRSCGGA